MKKRNQPTPFRFPMEFFELEPGGASWYGEIDGLKAGTEWFVDLVGADLWKRRRDGVASHFYDTILRGTPDEKAKGRYFDEKDQFSWYLFLAEAFIKHPLNYEVFFGCRVIPVIAAIGRNLPVLETVAGFRDTARTLVSSQKSQPNGILFEILVAAAYAREGWTVRFVPKQPGGARTYDLDVEKDGRRLAVECKRLEGGDYVENERARARALWSVPCTGLVHKEKRSVLASVDFGVELANVPDDYLLKRTFDFIKSQQKDYSWRDSTASGRLSDLDLGRAREQLKKGQMLLNSPVMNELLTGQYIRDDSLISIMSVKRGDTPRTIEDIDLAVLLRWSSSSEGAIDKKARDIQPKLVEANNQLPTDLPGIIHIGFEALSGGIVEQRRHQKIIDRARNFDRGQSNLQYIYCHYFAPETKPDEVVGFDETLQWAVGIEANRPLKGQFLILSENEKSRPGGHWETPES